MHTFRKLTPAFLQRLDHYLLTHYPALWATRLHFLGFYLALAFGLVILGFNLPVNLQNLPDQERQTALIAIPIGLAFLFWTWQISRVKVSDQFGHLKLATRWGIQSLMLLAIAGMIALPVLHHTVVTYRIGTALPKTTLEADIATYQAGAIYFKEQLKLRTNGPNREFYNQIRHSDLKDPNPALRIKWDHMEIADHYAAIEAYYALLRKYSDHAFLAYDPARIYGYFPSNQEIPVNYDFRQAEGETHEHILNILYARKDLSSLIHTQDANISIFEQGTLMGLGILLVVAWLAMMLFVQVGVRPFFLGLVMGLIGAGVSAFAMFLVDKFIDEEAALLIVFLAWMTLLTVQGMRHNHRRGLHLWKLSGLALAAALLPLLPLMLAIGTDSLTATGAEDYLFWATSLVAWAGWIGVYQPLIRHLQTAPQRN